MLPYPIHMTPLQAALLFRCLPLLPFSHYLPRLHLLLSTLATLLPSILPILALLFTTLSLFSLAGTHLFGGLLSSHHPQLQTTDYFQSGFLPLNFNDFPASMAVAFNL
ncbi:unnamed protein product [Closterium sp. Naga37s-1]|nr:unnamed protein product [Closterium sp. Naga37s-1]